MARPLCVLLLPLLACLAGGCGVADRLVLGVNRAALDPAGADRRVVTVDGRAVECWVARSPGATSPAATSPAATTPGPTSVPSGGGREPAAFVLLFVGRASRVEPWVAAVADSWGGRPVEVWGMNYPGFGGSDGPPRLDRVVPSAVGVYDAVRRVAGDRPVFCQASSLGTTAALALAARRPVAGLVLRNPPALRPLLLGYYGWWNLWLLAGPVALSVPADLDSVANARRVAAPAVFVTGGGDEVIPPAYQRPVVDAYAGPKRVIDVPGAHHADRLTQEAAAELADGRAWLWASASLGGGGAPVVSGRGSGSLPSG